MTWNVRAQCGTLQHTHWSPTLWESSWEQQPNRHAILSFCPHMLYVVHGYSKYLVVDSILITVYVGSLVYQRIWLFMAERIEVQKESLLCFNECLLLEYFLRLSLVLSLAISSSSSFSPIWELHRKTENTHTHELRTYVGLRSNSTISHSMMFQ